MSRSSLTEPCAVRGGPWLEVGEPPLAASPDDHAVAAPVVLVVDDPVEMAAFCWDAGFTVCVSESESGESTVIVTDPSGTRLVLAARDRVKNTNGGHHEMTAVPWLAG